MGTKLTARLIAKLFTGLTVTLLSFIQPTAQAQLSFAVGVNSCNYNGYYQSCETYAPPAGVYYGNGSWSDDPDRRPGGYGDNYYFDQREYGRPYYDELDDWNRNDHGHYRGGHEDNRDRGRYGNRGGDQGGDQGGDHGGERGRDRGDAREHDNHH